MLKSLMFKICRTVFQRLLAWWTKLFEGSVVIMRVSLPGRLDREKRSKSAIGVRYFKTL